MSDYDGRTGSRTLSPQQEPRDEPYGNRHLRDSVQADFIFDTQNGEGKVAGEAVEESGRVQVEDDHAADFGGGDCVVIFFGSL